MNILNEIKEGIKQIPNVKDRNLANSFLGKRDFVNLKELVDSDVTKEFNKINKLINNEATADSEECLTAQMIYNELRELQCLVTEQAKAFLEDDLEYLEDLEFYDEF